MEIIETDFSEALLIQPRIFPDERGYFFESYHAKKYAGIGIKQRFVQDNRSHSDKGVLRGLHYQIKQAQGKLVSVLVGEIYDVIVDLRRYSPTFGKWQGFILSAENKTILWVPPGFTHGFFTISAAAEIQYKVTNYYSREWERTLLWNDPELGIEWPLNAGVEVIVSDKDQAGLPFAQVEVYSEEKDLEG
jgi:dTDP-4-dehydrorhamnose 3,5-epimerase